MDGKAKILQCRTPGASLYINYVIHGLTAVAIPCRRFTPLKS